MADAPFVCCRELLPATGVTQSIFFRGYNSISGLYDDYLATLQCDSINFYKVTRSDSVLGYSAYLSLIHCKKLFGKPNCIMSYEDPNGGDDLLLLGLDAGKIVVLQCNMEMNTFDTLIMCNCEEDAYGMGSELHVQLTGMRRHLGLGDQCTVRSCLESPLLCATIYGQFLVFLPIPSALSTTELIKQKNEESIHVISTENDATIRHGSFSVDVGATLGLTGPIIDSCFLSGYSRPVLIILQQSGLLPIGHAARVRHCCTVTALAISPESKTLSILWQRTHLPYDSLKLIPFQHTGYAGTVCVICMNSVIILNQEEAQGLAMNGFAAITVSQISHQKTMNLHSTVGVKSGEIGLQSWINQEVGLELDGSHWFEDTCSIEHGNDVDNTATTTTSIVQDSSSSPNNHQHTHARNVIVGSLKDGSILRISMVMSTPGMLSSVHFRPEIVAASVRSSSFCASPTGDLWFLGSRHTASVLLSVERSVEKSKTGGIVRMGEGGKKNLLSRNEEQMSSFLSPASKRVRNDSIVSEEEDGHNDGVGRLVPSTAATGTPTRSTKPINTKKTKQTNKKTKTSKAANTDKADTNTDGVIPSEGSVVVVEVMNMEEEERALYGGVSIDTADTTAQQMEDSDTMSYLHPTATSATTTSAATAIAKFGNALPEHINLTLVDSIPVLGAMLDGVTTKQDSLFDTANAVTWDRNHHTEYRNEVQSTAASYIAERESRDGILLSSGLDEDGSLLRVYNGLHLSKLASRGLPGVSRVFTWSCIEYGLLLAIYENKTKVLLCTEQVILSSKERSELQFKEIPGLDSGFIDHSSTINMGCIATIQNDSILLQIIPNGVRLLRMTTSSTGGRGTCNGFGEPLQDVLVADSKELGGLGGEEGELVMAGDICMGYVTLHTTSQKLYVLKYNTMEESLELIHTITTPSGTTSNSIEVEGRDTGNLTESTVTSASLYYGTFDAAYQVSHYYTSQSDTNKPQSCESSDTSPEFLLEQQQQLLLQQSKVVVEDEELTLYGEVLPNTENQDEHNTSTNAAECNGKKKSNKVNNSRNTKPAHTTSTITTASTTANATTPPLTDGDSTEQAYLILAELHGYISIIRLSTMLTVFRSRQFTTLSDTVTMHTNMTQQEQEEDIILEGLIIESKLVRLMDQMYPEDSDRSTLCMVFLLNTGDLVTYRGIESRGYTSAFHKIDQRPVVNRRAPDGTKLVRSFSAEGASSTGISSTTAGVAVSDDTAVVVGDTTTTPTATTGAAVDDVYTTLQAYLSITEYTHRGGPSLSHLPSSQQARGGVLVAGNDAVIITAVQGMPSVLPLGFPEVPFINYGQHCITPLQVGSVNAITVLWFEWDDLELIKNPTTPTAVAGVNKAARAATFGIYQQINNIEIYPHSDVSIKRIPVGRTIHRFSEILNRTDDRTQQALLEKKTFVLACSVEKKQGFLPSVLTEEELQEDSELYERYYTSLESFCQPDENYGKPPLISSRLHTLALLQGTTVVDNYDLPINECITDTTVLYLNLEKYINFPGNLIPMKVNEKRVFIAACTAVIEKRGEDTQGNGRLLLFALDYALFERDDDEEHANSTDTTEKNHNNSTLENGNTTTNATTSNTSSTTTATTTNGADKEQLSVAQAKFLGAIKPKLRLIWSGPGPASVVRQLGEYVLSTVSGTIYVYKFNTAAMELEQVSFYFTQVSYCCYYYCTVTATDAIFMVFIYLFYSLYLLFIYI